MRTATLAQIAGYSGEVAMNRILVTGGTGFVGARVVRQLVDQGRDVALLVRDMSDTRRAQGDLIERCTVIRGNLALLNRCSEGTPEGGTHPKAVLPPLPGTG